MEMKSRQDRADVISILLGMQKNRNAEKFCCDLESEVNIINAKSLMENHLGNTRLLLPIAFSLERS